jgi:CrcB protein
MYLPLPFPLATLIVNVVGCFFIGAFYAYSERQTFHPQLWLLLTVGLCGGFTTFSAFGIETITLMKSGQIHLSLLNIAANLITGLAAVWLGQAVFLNR